MNSQYYLAHAMMASVYMQTCHFDEALECYARARKADANSKFVDSLEAMTLAAAGQKKRASEMLAEIRLRAEHEYISPVSIAYVCTALGDHDGAFAYLDQAIHDRDPNILGLKSNPIFDALREDERYHALLKKMQLE
jgi:tetratricopeptide (TPR) repeat protein